MRSLALCMSTVVMLAGSSCTQPADRSSEPSPSIGSAASADETAAASKANRQGGIGAARPSHSSIGYFVAENAKVGHPVPDAVASGSFQVEDGCLVFRSADDGERYLPVFPAGTRFFPQGAGPTLVQLNGRLLNEGRQYRLGGAPGALEEADVLKVAPEARANCPRRYFLIGEVLP